MGRGDLVGCRGFCRPGAGGSRAAVAARRHPGDAQRAAANVLPWLRGRGDAAACRDLLPSVAHVVMTPRTRCMCRHPGSPESGAATRFGGLARLEVFARWNGCVVVRMHGVCYSVILSQLLRKGVSENVIAFGSSWMMIDRMHTGASSSHKVEWPYCGSASTGTSISAS